MIRRIKKFLAKRYYKLGGKLFEQNNFDDAIDSYTKAIELDPTYSSAYFNRSLCYAIEDNYELASRDLLMVMKLEPNSFDAPYAMGLISEYKQDFKTALKWYDESIKKNPNYSPAIEKRKKLEKIFREKKVKPSQGGLDWKITTQGGHDREISDYWEIREEYMENPYYREKKGRSWFWTLLEILLTVILGVLLYVFVMDYMKHIEIPASPFLFLVFKALLYLMA